MNDTTTIKNRESYSELIRALFAISKVSTAIMELHFPASLRGRRHFQWLKHAIKIDNTRLTVSDFDFI